MNINVFDSISVSEKADIGNFVKRVGSQFIKDGQRYRFVGSNRYELMVSGWTQANIAAYFAAYAAVGAKVVRFWAFDTASTGPLHHLVYPTTGTNLITNTSFETDTAGYTVGVQWARSNDAAHDGTYSMKLNSTNGNYGALTYEATVLANTDYVWTYWYKNTHTGGQSNQLPPVQWVGYTGDGTGRGIADGGILGSPQVWTKQQLKFNSGNHTTIQLNLINYGGQNLGYFDDFHLGLAPTPVLETIESNYVQMDMILDEARKAGIKLVMVLMAGTEDNPSSFNAKYNFINWANATAAAGLTYTYGTLVFFTNLVIQALIKQTFDDLIDRVNTINGRSYKNDDAIFSWEIANELRTSNYDSTAFNLMSGTGGLGDVLSTYIKSKDPNHLVAFTASEHGLTWYNGDRVWNGPYYGTDYNTTSQLTNVDYLSIHLYPSENNGGQLHTYGIKLGYSNSSNPQPTEAGFIAQIQDYVTVAKANGKPVVIDEFGYVRYEQASNTITTQYPRSKIYETVMRTFFGADGDGFIPWNLGITDTDPTYNVNITGNWDGNTTNLNYDDRVLARMIGQLNSDAGTFYSGTITPLGNATLYDSATTSETNLTQLDKYLLSFFDNIIVEESVYEINKEVPIAYDFVVEGEIVSEHTQPMEVDNVNLSQTILGPHIV